MDWLKDKKNIPIIATVAGVIILAVCVIGYMKLSGGSESTPTDTASAPADPGMGGTPAAGPGTTPMPSGATPPGSPTAAPAANPAGSQPAGAETAPTAGATKGAKTASSEIKPMESWRSDPFLPVGYKPPKKNQHKATPPIRDFPFFRLPSPNLSKKADLIPEPAQPARRMAGLLINDRVFAIIESNGKSEIVQPGDTLSDRLATVEKIEKDKVILKTTSRHAKYIVVRMAASAKQNVPDSTTNNTTMPGMMPMMGPRAGMMRPPMPYGPM